MKGELCYVTANNEINLYEGMEMSLRHSVSINLGPDRSFTSASKLLPCVNSDAVAIQTCSNIGNESLDALGLTQLEDQHIAFNKVVSNG
ncbi:hypothetical protein KY290_024081 [Solanum tuberosum]|uniref:Uncharacterized protein n=1 Tax=Solanum tuberosum TaxID=4113 RepID=A0ABQ7UPP4_SOLTU|nr:hypothetical protein KY285_022844 [Solanum tuberosum]KAH0753811.1 hypothetical protein KY290_024081 [Solanum tuberosum]